MLLPHSCRGTCVVVMVGSPSRSILYYVVCYIIHSSFVPASALASAIEMAADSMADFVVTFRSEVLQLSGPPAVMKK